MSYQLTAGRSSSLLSPCYRLLKHDLILVAIDRSVESDCRHCPLGVLRVNADVAMLFRFEGIHRLDPLSTQHTIDIIPPFEGLTSTLFRMELGDDSAQLLRRLQSLIGLTAMRFDIELVDCAADNGGGDHHHPKVQTGS